MFAFSHSSFHLLTEVINTVPPIDLMGMRLLKACPTATGLFPQNIPRETVKEAVIELVQYTERCNSTARRLRNLAPIPLTNLSLIEYGL